jgi:hypothetical protein
MMSRDDQKPTATWATTAVAAPVIGGSHDMDGYLTFAHTIID